MNREHPDVQAGVRKDRGTRDQIANIHLLIEKAKEFQKNIYFCITNYAKDFVWNTTKWKCGKFLKRWEYQTTFPASWETCVQVKKQVRTGHGKQTGSKLGKEYIKTVYCHPVYLTSMQSVLVVHWLSCVHLCLHHPSDLAYCMAYLASTSYISAFNIVIMDILNSLFDKFQKSVSDLTLVLMFINP